MKKYLFILTSIVVSLQLSAQDDVNEILDRLSKKMASYKCFYFEYTIKTEDIQLKTSELQYGKVLTKGKKFRLSTKDVYLYSNGETQWQYLKPENEVVISTVDANSDDFFINPIGFITGDRKNFKQRLKNEVIEDGINLTEIDFYPRDLKTPYAYIRVRINEKKQMPYSIKYVGKDGVHYTIKINNSSTDIEMPDDSEFVFEPSKYQNITVVDLRE
ncbi:MAG: outer membrane lipoprotein carrier protein LolA [Prevotellaceae bacterium]|jgi:outer membrane lipoprotein-sorting protein|nr:outer membrane lipoprotein carrier protein LolA [Prevotellaceae bacterium]